MPKKNKEEKKHSLWSASGSERWLNCPGSIKLCKDAPEQEDSEAALEGTKAHLLLEKWLIHATTKLGSFIFPKGYTDEMKANVKVAIDEVKAICKREKIPLKNVRTEQKVSLAHIYEELHGTLDIEIAEDFGTLRVYDYKNGTKKVNVFYKSSNGIGTHNTQLVYYLLAKAHEYNYDFLDYEIGIIQPRTTGDKVNRIKLSTKTLKNYEDFFKRGVERTLKPNARLFPGDWCYFCPAKSICPALQRLAKERNLANAQMEFDVIE